MERWGGKRKIGRYGCLVVCRWDRGVPEAKVGIGRWGKFEVFTVLSADFGVARSWERLYVYVHLEKKVWNIENLSELESG